ARRSSRRSRIFATHRASKEPIRTRADGGHIMAKTTESQTDQGRTSTVVTQLVPAADGDTLYRDVYLRRAAALLSPVITEERHRAALGERERATKLLAQARAAVERQDWARVRELGAQTARLQ